jgi:anti-anti-sigma regulatory factor
MPARCPVRLVRGVPVAAAPDRLDDDNSRRLGLVLAELANRGYATVVVDLSNTRFCGQAGSAMLMRAHERACAEGGELRLVAPTRVLPRMFALGRGSCRPRRFASPDEAVAELPAAAIAPSAASTGPAGTIVWLVRDNPRPQIGQLRRRARCMTTAPG